jgi:DNA modification methylase
MLYQASTVVVTSPPYNIGIKYHTYGDLLEREHYLTWTQNWLAAVKSVLRPGGSFFLNVAGKPSDPWLAHDELVEQCLKLHGLDRIEVVLDPFMGIGSTAVACKRLGVSHCIGFDIDEEYLKEAKHRVTQLESKQKGTSP